MPTPKPRMTLRGQPAKKKNGTLEARTLRKIIKAQTSERKQTGPPKTALKDLQAVRTERRKGPIGKTLTEARKTLQERKAQKAGPKRGKL